jgi:two-component system CheB/CheR fusion protein
LVQICRGWTPVAEGQKARFSGLRVTAESKFLVVGIGASAGGLQALGELFRPMPANADMAFVIMTHQAHGHTSSLPEILARDTPLSVAAATDGMKVAPGKIYVCPPSSIMTIDSGHLKLQVPVEGQSKPIDVFFTSLARDCAESAIGILLSGAGSDGTLGIKAIKEEGGLTLAQGGDGLGPTHPGMPDAAIAAGVIDVVLPAAQMADRLMRFAEDHRAGRTKLDSAGQENAYTAIHRTLQNQLGHDFSGYKQKTFSRRVARRMQVLEIPTVEAYVQRLQETPEEVNLLFRDLLIGVTNFFRDESAFQTLEQTVIPKLFEGRNATDTIRVWVPGCSTGEEVYSIAILLREYRSSIRVSPKLQIFATDIDDAALAVARTGKYPAPLLDNVSPQRLKRFFSTDDISYTVNKDIRDLCVFSTHSVIRDPPFSRIDLISCRNLLIYFGNEFQSRVIPVFHFALRPKGYLFLGTSENVGGQSQLFAPADKKHRIFQRRDNVVGPLQFSNFLPNGGQIPTHHDQRDQSNAVSTLRRAVETRVLDRFSPPHVVINRYGEIIHFSSRTGKYLEPAVGLPVRQIMAMARKSMRLDLRAAIREATETRRIVVKQNVPVELDDRSQFVDITIEPLTQSESDLLLLVLFADATQPSALQDPHAESAPAGDKTADRLEQELRETRERLQATIEEYETAVEELKSSNEELQSMNEELQSTNEELETKKEELQSVNEELHTVNAELSAKVDEVDRANSDLQNLFESTQIATVFLDSDLIIRGFTPAVKAIFNLISSDRGRPLTDIVNHLEPDGDLRRDILTVLEHREPVERRVRRKDGAGHYIMRILPYRDRNHVINGTLVTFVDVTRLVEAESQQKVLVEELNHRVRNMLTVIGAIASQTAASTPVPAKFKEVFLGRLQSMGAAYGLVSDEHWGPISLDAILETELKIFETTRDRIRIAGSEVLLQPPQALALGLIFHELATNAVKHGALAKARGSIDISWTVDRSALTLIWQERGGRQVDSPKRAGFGTQLIKSQVQSVLNGKIKLSLVSTGLTARLTIPSQNFIVP